MATRLPLSVFGGTINRSLCSRIQSPTYRSMPPMLTLSSYSFRLQFIWQKWVQTREVTAGIGLASSRIDAAPSISPARSFARYSGMSTWAGQLEEQPLKFTFLAPKMEWFLFSPVMALQVSPPLRRHWILPPISSG